MTAAAWVVQARAAARRAWGKAMCAFAADASKDIRQAKRAAGNSGWWSDLQDHWAEESYRDGERWLDRERW